MSPIRALVLVLAFGAAAVAGGLVVASRHARHVEARSPRWSDVEFADCATVTRGPVCELPQEGRIHLWVPQAAGAKVDLATDRGPLLAEEPRDVEGGTSLRVTLPASAHELRVAGAAGKTWTLALAPNAPAPSWADEIDKIRQAGELDEARARLTTILDGARGVDRARAEGLLARTELARSDYESAVVHFRAAIDLDHAEGIVSREALDAFALSFTLTQRLHRYAEARAVLAGAGEAIAATPEGTARLPFYVGVLLDVTANPHSALQSFDDARQRAARLAMHRLERTAQSSYAVELAGSGRRTEALAMMHALADAGDDGAPCDRADLLDSIGIWTLRSLDASGARAPATVTLRAAHDAFEAAASSYPRVCADAYRHADVVVGLAEVALREGDLTAARARLREARGELHTHSAAFDDVAFDLEARLALADHDPRAALAAYDAQERATGGLLPPEFAYSTQVGRGEALEALGRAPDALAAYEQAETLLDEESVWIPLGSGRLTFLADRQRSARNRIDLLLRLKRAPEAMSAARASRVRAVRMFERGARIEGLAPPQRVQWEKSLETYRQLRGEADTRAEDDWKLPADRVAQERERREKLEAKMRQALDAAFALLADAHASSTVEDGALAPGELVLAFHPLREGWAGFSKSGSAITSFRFDLPPAGAAPDVVALRLFGPVRDLITAATRVHVFATGALQGIDFHALPFGDGALLDHAVVTYGADLSGPPRANDPAARRALIVADPNDNLAATVEEAGRVERAIAAAEGWKAVTLLRDEATSARVREALPGVSWFHYAGHGTFDAGHTLGSALLLANGTRLTVGDVLALPRGPEKVVLSGCETARADGDGAVEGLGLAQAFVAAGAQVAVAPARPVEDATAAKLASLLYRGFAKEPFDLPSALRDAQRTLRDSAPSSDWAAFRAVTP